MLDEAISSLHMCAKCFKKKVKVNAAPVHSVGLDYETEDEKQEKKLLKKRKGGIDGEEFGADQDDASLSRLNPSMTNQSISLDEHDKKKL